MNPEAPAVERPRPLPMVRMAILRMLRDRYPEAVGKGWLAAAPGGRAIGPAERDAECEALVASGAAERVVEPVKRGLASPFCVSYRAVPTREWKPES